MVGGWKDVMIGKCSWNCVCWAHVLSDVYESSKEITSEIMAGIDMFTSFG